MVPTGSDTIKRCGFIGVGKVLMEDVCHSRGRLWGLQCSSYTQSGTQLLLLSVDQDIELSSPSPV